MKENIINEIGNKYGLWTVLNYDGKAKDGSLKFKCKCKCGLEKSLTLWRTKKSPNAGCSRCVNIKHGGCYSVEYEAYRSAKYRCQNPNDQAYKNYGGRGIQFKFKNYQEFINHIGKKPSKEYSLDRINTNGHYERGNVRWATIIKQNRNKRDNCWLTHEGETLILTDWAIRMGVDKRIINTRLRRGWSVSDAITKPLRKRCKV